MLDAVAEIIHVDDDMEIYTSGATNIFKYPELSDKQSAQEIISAFEEKAAAGRSGDRDAWPVKKITGSRCISEMRLRSRQ